MKIRLKTHLPVLLSMLGVVSLAFSQDVLNNDEAYSDLIGLFGSTSDSVVVMPEDLVNIVSEIYTEETESYSTSSDVLAFIDKAFSEHGYHETGNWAPKKNFVSYIPYQGKLPDYDPTDFILPVSGYLTSIYGYRPQFKRFHHGIDVAVNLGDTINCSLPGVVTKIGYEHGGYGRYLVVSHAGGVETLYGHLSSSIVSPGQSLDAGEPLGTGGNTGNSTGPHLHFETRYRGVAIDPISWFNLTDRFQKKIYHENN